MLHITFI